VTLTEFLLARIAEDEKAARARFITRRMIGGKMVDVPILARPGVWAWSPARVLDECGAKRRIVEAARHAEEAGESATYTAGEDSRWMAYEEVLRALALPYAAHPDYDPTWALTDSPE
jgi:hypothetical protein